MKNLQKKDLMHTPEITSDVNLRMSPCRQLQGHRTDKESL